MRFRVPFHYEVIYTPYRAQNPRSVPFASETELEIREIDPAEAPVALLVSCEYEDRFSPLGPDKLPRQILFFENEFWREIGPVNDLVAAMAAGTDWRAVGPFGGCRHLRALAGGYHGYERLMDRQALLRENPNPMRQLEDDGGAGMATRLARRARDVISVDGTAFVREYEPTFRLRNGDRGLAMVIGTAPPFLGEPFSSDYLTDYNPLNTWNILRSQEVKEIAARRAADQQVNVVDSTFVDVLMPEPLIYADHARALCHAAETILSTLCSSANHLSRDQAARMYALRDALAGWSGLAQATPRLIEAVQMLAEMEVPDRAELEARAALPGGLLDDRNVNVASKLAKGVQSVSSARLTAQEGLDRWEDPLPNLSWHYEAKQVGRRPDDLIEIVSFDAARYVGKAMEVDLSDWARQAAQGDAKLLVDGSGLSSRARYYSREEWRAAVLVDPNSGNEPVVLGAVGNGGRPVPDEILQKALRQASNAVGEAADWDVEPIRAPAP